jgi:hypothetical protein
MIKLPCTTKNPSNIKYFLESSQPFAEKISTHCSLNAGILKIIFWKCSQ